MNDVWFVLLMLAVFGLLALVTKGAEAVNATNLVGLILAAVLSVFLIVALIFPEKF